MKKIYIDSNIYIDYFDGRSNGLRPLGEFAFSVLRKTFECEFVIIISGLVLDELDYNTYKEKGRELMKDLKEKNKVIEIKQGKEDIKLARNISKQRKTSYNDTLHAVIAKRLKAEYLVTRNIKHFSKLIDLVDVCYPESL
ncbi:type II toxin-antitoxin system VapC family toxin [Candidatus Woesearchaeota archaeon]|nr:type II toxin-antitoxin system VapC family toxin [Candidatus Woesearchaeota archaeon]